MFYYDGLFNYLFLFIFFLGSVVMRVQADDSDEDANIKYSLLKPLKIFDRRGFLMKEEVEDYTKFFRWVLFIAFYYLLILRFQAKSSLDIDV